MGPAGVSVWRWGLGGRGRGDFVLFFVVREGDDWEWVAGSLAPGGGVMRLMYIWIWIWI